MSILLSILIPVRNEDENVNIISKEIITKISIQSYEILFINDFSEDNTASEDLKKQLQNLYANKNDSSSINPYNFKKKFN